MAPTNSSSTSTVNTQKKREVKPKWLHHRCRFQKSATTQLAADFWIDSDAVLLLIFESTTTQLLAANLWIDSGAVLTVNFWIGSNTVKSNKKLVLDQPILGENENRNQPKDNPKGG